MALRTKGRLCLNFYEIDTAISIFTSIIILKGGHHKYSDNGQYNADNKDYPFVGFHFSKFGSPKLDELF